MEKEEDINARPKESFHPLLLLFFSIFNFTWYLWLYLIFAVHFFMGIFHNFHLFFLPEKSIKNKELLIFSFFFQEDSMITLATNLSATQKMHL